MMGREFKSPESVSNWKQVANLPPGAEEIILYRDEKSGTYARLLRLPPGFTGTDKALKHDFDEVVYIIQGGIVDRLTNKAYPAGFYAFFPEGLEHGPLAAPVGALFIEFRHYTAKGKK
jgi:hypothetical protein